MPALTVRLALFVLLLALSGLALRDLHISTELNALLGAEYADPALRRASEGPGSRVLLLGIGGGERDQRLQASRALAEALHADPRFTEVRNGLDLATLPMDGPLQRYRYLLRPPGELSAEALNEALGQRLLELSAGLELYPPERLREDPSLALVGFLEDLRPAQGPHTVRGQWLSRDGKLALLTARLAPAGEPLLAGELDTVLREHFHASRPRTAALHLISAGAPVIGARSASLIRAEVQSLSLWATAGLILLLALAYRSPRLMLLSTLPLASGILVAAATVSLLFGQIHGITLAFGITLLGVALDYPLHLFSHLDAGRRHTAGIWPTLGLSLLTTVLGYSALALTDFAGLAQLGVFAVAGLLTAAALTRFLLPALSAGLTVAPPRRLPGGGPAPALAGALLGTVALLAGLWLWLHPTPWNDDLGALNPAPPESVREDQRLREALGVPELSHLLIAEADSAEAALQAAERGADTLEALRDEGALGDYESPSRYLPSARTQRRRQQALPGMDTLRQSLATASAGTPFEAMDFTPFLEQVAASRQLPPLQVAQLQGTPLAARLDNLLLEEHGRWLALLPLQGVTAPAAIHRAFAATPELRYLNLRAQGSTVLAQLREATWGRLGLGGATILLCLLIGLRGVRAVAETAAPVAVALLATAALMLASAPGLTLFHLVSLLVVAGIGLDYALFFRRPEADPEQQRRTLHGLLTCVASSTLAFGLLGTTEIPVLQFIGRTVAVGVVLSFLFAWLLHGRRRL
ncbi:MMPL family transporter [Alkalilimnicola sp. S0819]|uniref:MMPL family transporter n=1 Tax=Alkalilimnicola sp. S0819 TaxID=2613922 RepID=UPI0012628D3B|nr:MMPL family transporter [Alkalilimnicola sp. S0819]KAB7624181.1 MMPL family transporter [Alkalilimnicola sp. S0819]MPQ16435.1 MMPL family transporter [Alkalilimnicola sp. S0819]